MSNIAIRCEGLSKRYRLGQRERYKALRDVVTEAFCAPFRHIAHFGQRPARNGQGTRRTTRDQLWAIDDVSLQIMSGEVVGLIGPNGAGKTTLLKVLSRITTPTKGYAEIRGRVGSLLEVGTGFHPELTGRENVYLSGAILGMKKAEIDRNFDEIVAFAEVERFLDTPVKHFSSGMYVRLAFAVAAHLEPEILLVDEILAVGDAAFQKKCLGRMRDVAACGRTVLFVSHNMAAIGALCSSALVLDRGRVSYQGSTTQCIDAYAAMNSQSRGRQWVRPEDHPQGTLVIRRVDSSLSGEQPQLVLELQLTCESHSRHSPAFIAVDILDVSGTPLMQALPRHEGFLEDSKPQHLVTIAIHLPPLIPGQYLVGVWVGSHNTESFDEVREAIMFEVHESPTRGRSFPHTRDHGCIVPNSTVQYH